jgi:hypothetical protein
MSFINANTANPTTDAIGYQNLFNFANQNNIVSANTATIGPMYLTQGVWLINASINISTSNFFYYAQLNIGANGLIQPELDFGYLNAQGYNEFTLNVMTVVYANANNYPVYASVYAVTQSTTPTTNQWSMNGSGPPVAYTWPGPPPSPSTSPSVLRATKIA